ncbi:MAG TPA: helix-turn-helix domain-containing protein, partial [Gemmatimonadaceae bacterium]
NFVEHVTILAQPGSKIQIHQLPLDQEVDLGSAITGLPAFPSSDAYHVAKEQVLATFEKTYVTRLVARASGNMSRAARLASVDRTTLYRLLERHGFRRDLSESLNGDSPESLRINRAVDVPSATEIVSS